MEGEWVVRLDIPVTATDSRRVGWGILSTGHIASVFARDLRLLSEEAEPVAVCSREMARARGFAADHGLARAYGSVAELAADEDVDVVYVASVHSNHYAAALSFVEAGKAVLVEKPLTVTAAEAGQLIAAARERRVFVMEAVWTRTNPLIRRAVELVRNGTIGAVRHVGASFGFAFGGAPNHRLLDPQQAGGAVLDLGVYPVHGVDLFLGEPSGLAGFGSLGSTGVDTHAAALLRFAATPDRAAATATVACSLETDLPTRLEVFGREGRLVFDSFIRPEELLVFRGHDPRTEPERLITQIPGAGYTFEAQEVMRCLRAGAVESPLVPWESTLGAMRTLDRWRAAVSAS